MERTQSKFVKLAQRLVGLGAILLLVGLLLPTPVSAQAVTVSVDAPASVAPGDYFTADINISEVTDFDAADFRVVFDSTVLEIEDITPGADITDGLIGGTTIPVTVTTQISAGIVKVIVNVPGTPGVTGSGYLCQIRFHAIGAAGTSSTIDLQNGTLSDKDAAAIPATWTEATVNVGAPPTVAFSGATYSVGEGDGSATITVDLSAASAETVTVDYATSDGTATAGSDYTAASGALSFSPGDTSETFSVGILEDALVEGDQTVDLALSNPTNATLGTPSVAVLTIVDNDVAPEELAADAGGPYSGTVDESVSLSGSATGGTPPYSYAWDLDDDGVYDDSFAQNPSYTWYIAGSYTVGLEVTDDIADTDMDTASVDISAAPPPPAPGVGGTAYPPDKLAVLAPWIALGVGLAVLGWLVVRRRRAYR